MKAEIIYGLPFDDYKAIDALNMSLLKEIAESPGKLDWRRQNPWAPTPEAILGSAIHTLLLEPSDFPRRFASAPQRRQELPDHFIAALDPVPTKANGEPYKDYWASKPGKQWVADQEELGCVVHKPSDWNGDGLKLTSGAGKAWKAWTEEQGIHVLTASTAAKARGAAAAAMEYPPARNIIEASEHEVTLVWPETVKLPDGREVVIWCKGRMDCYDHPNETDVKTTGMSVHHESIGTTAFKAGWHLQRAFYGMGVEAITGEMTEAHRVIAIEVDEPWRCEVFRLGEGELEMGREKVRGLLEKYAYWQDQGEWPLNSGQVMTLNFPGWALK